MSGSPCRGRPLRTFSILVVGRADEDIEGLGVAEVREDPHLGRAADPRLGGSRLLERQGARLEPAERLDGARGGLRDARVPVPDEADERRDGIDGADASERLAGLHANVGFVVVQAARDGVGLPLRGPEQREHARAHGARLFAERPEQRRRGARPELTEGVSRHGDHRRRV